MVSGFPIGSPALSTWLRDFDPWVADNGALVQAVKESDRPADLLSVLANELFEARFTPEVVADYAKVLGVEAASDLVSDLLSTVDNLRRGYFGEVIAAGCLRDIDQCWIPVQKLRSMISSDQSLPGVDVLGAYVNAGRFEALVFVEAKVRTARNRRVVFDAAQELLSDLNSRHTSILFYTLTELKKRDDPMYQAFLDYLKRRDDSDTEDLPYVYLVLEKGKWSDQDISLLDDLAPLPPGFRVSVVEIDNLAELVTAAYSRIGISVDETDDE